MTEHIDDMTAPQGGKSNSKRTKRYVDPNTIPMKDGDILKLNPEYTVSETEWKDVEGNLHHQSNITAAQLIIARKYKLVVPAPLAVMMANGTEEQCRLAIARLKLEYAQKLLENYSIKVEDIERAARAHAGVPDDADIENVRANLPGMYARYHGFKHGVLWLSKYRK